MKVTFSDNIGSTPAIVRRDTGEIFLNRKTWFTFPQAYRQFILNHEVGHYALQTTNELEADHFAFTQIAGTQRESLKNAVRTLFGVLPFNTELQGCRLQNMYRLGLAYDQLKQPTTERLTEIRRIETDMKRNYSHDTQLQEYMTTSRRGKQTDYEFPGYDPSQFLPSVGNWFRDIPINAPSATPATPIGTGSGGGVPWPTQTNIFTPTYTAPVPVATTIPIPGTSGSVPLDLVPTFELPFTIDWKSVAIGILVILAIMGLSKI